MVLRPPFWPPVSLPQNNRTTLLTGIVVILLVYAVLAFIEPLPQLAY